MKRNKKIGLQQKTDNTQLIISVLFLVALALAPLFRGLYHENDFLLFGAVVLGCCIVLFFKEKQHLQFDYIDALFMLLCLCYVLSLWNAANLREAYLGLVKTVTYFSCYYIVRYCFPQHEQKTVILKAVVFSLTMMTALTIMTRIGVIHFPGAIVGNRFSGTLQYANTFAAMMLLAISLTYYLDLSAENKQRPLFLMINYINTVAFFSSASRGALIVYLPLMFFYLIFWRNKERFFIRLSLVNVAAIATSALMFKLHNWQIALVILSSIAVIYLLDKFAAKGSSRLQIFITTCVLVLGGGLIMLLAAGSALSRLTQMNLSSSGVVGRFVFYLDALKIFNASPLLGHGADGWEYLYRSVQTYYYNTKLVHSNLFQLLVEIGLLGTLTYYAIFIVAGMKNLKAFFSKEKQLEAIVLITLIAVQLHALIDFDLSMPAMSLFVFVLLGLLAGEYSKGFANHNIIRVPILLFIILSFISVGSFFIAGKSVQGVIAQVKEGKVQVDKIREHQDSLAFAGILDPLNAYYRDYLGQYLIAEGIEKRDEKILAEGLKKLDSALRLSPYDYHHYVDKGKTLAQLERYEEAFHCFRQIIDIMPYHQTGYEYLIRAYTTLAFDKKDASYAERAVDVYNLAVENFNKIPPEYMSRIPERDKLSNSEILNFQMGAACFLLENYEEGLKHFEVALKYIGKHEVAEEIKGWIAVGNQRLNRNDGTALKARPDMVQQVEKLLKEFHK